MNLYRAQFPIKDIADTVVAINNNAFDSPLAISLLYPLLWLDEDQLEGNNTVNCVKTNKAPLKITFNNTNDGDYTVVASPVQPLEFFGPHPTHKPH